MHQDPSVAVVHRGCRTMTHQDIIMHAGGTMAHQIIITSCTQVGPWLVNSSRHARRWDQWGRMAQRYFSTHLPMLTTNGNKGEWVGEGGEGGQAGGGGHYPHPETPKPPNPDPDPRPRPLTPTPAPPSLDLSPEPWV